MILSGDGSWSFTAKFTGTLEVLDVVATWFGGDYDSQDSGETACGYPTKGHPELVGCSLPMELCNQSPSTKGSPIPRLPWGLFANGKDNPDGAHVEVWRTDKSEALSSVPLIDIGPAKSASVAQLGGFKKYFHHPKYLERAVAARKIGKPHVIDLTVAAFQKLGGKLSDGVLLVSYRING